MNRPLILLYGLTCWLMFLGVFAYGCGFVGNFLVPKAIDGEPTDPLWLALLVNASLIGVFGVQHSVMSRPGFKRVWTRIIPASIERSTYVLISNLLLILLFWQWRPLGGTIWEVHNELGRGILWGVFATGWLIIPLASFMTNHFDLFGVRQTWYYFRNRSYEPLEFQVRGLYRYVRHPLYVGWITAFWATPTMTTAHLVFAGLLTIYILLVIPLEERDLVQHLGRAYDQYRRSVPGLFPHVGLKSYRYTDRPTSVSEKTAPVCVRNS